MEQPVSSREKLSSKTEIQTTSSEGKTLLSGWGSEISFELQSCTFIEWDQIVTPFSN
ncbi:hypothetical protein [Pseudomonas sp. FP1740]|jgi:hypothetical protein|uniref:hypothetical protein n=1 Tax=Pseudomonas sp. FP1740 TaxID=2954078 RepID=UPI002732D1F3|nr:hypothetical protein [Pseudomonas sp. FP1740]WLG42747.1 hypothetical protein PSH69_17820 [Pseudomonas sp. FP1740]